MLPDLLSRKRLLFLMKGNLGRPIFVMCFFVHKSPLFQLGIQTTGKQSWDHPEPTVGVDLSLVIIKDHYSHLVIIKYHYSHLVITKDHYSHLVIIKDHYSHMVIIKDHYSHLVIIKDHYSHLMCVSQHVYNHKSVKSLTQLVIEVAQE